MITWIYRLIPVVYPALALAGFIITVRRDNFAIFDPTYSGVWFVIVPGLFILLTIGLALTGRAPRRAWRLSICLWIALVTWGHSALVNMAAAGV